MIKRFILAAIRSYQQTLSPNRGATCRYLPTCSHYAIEAIETHGVVKGTALSLWRIMRCNPFSKGGYDPVPLHRNKEI